MSYAVCRRRSLDPVFLWLWRRPAVTALVQPLAWKPPYAVSATLNRQKTKDKKRQNKQTNDKQKKQVGGLIKARPDRATQLQAAAPLDRVLHGGWAKAALGGFTVGLS